MRFPSYDFGPRCSASSLGSRQYLNPILHARLKRASTALQEQILTDLGTNTTPYPNPPPHNKSKMPFIRYVSRSASDADADADFGPRGFAPGFGTRQELRDRHATRGALRRACKMLQEQIANDTGDLQRVVRRGHYVLITDRVDVSPA
ncbi:hypothetical protein BTUL_0071g00030 [Botrytis tulipae]|uniref:Uncharacterized protein n=1 Tax=Botrytis tulipae TaxID=87230 RepID=A0A4Z1ELM4_9HELO|nr:hypothetical protein BTUL_0071g00030 [Botrytis tulipae]